MVYGAIVPIKILGKALPAHVNPSSSCNILSLDWFQQNLTQFDPIDGDSVELPFCALGKTTFT